ncbi:hypothetical protein [Amycolatopsis sp. NPDC051372]
MLPIDLPLKCMIADGRLAMVHLDTADYDSSAHLVVYRSGLLTLLIDFFETLCEMVIPLSRERQPAETAAGLSQRERTI